MVIWLNRAAGERAGADSEGRGEEGRTPGSPGQGTCQGAAALTTYLNVNLPSHNLPRCQLTTRARSPRVPGPRKHADHTCVTCLEHKRGATLPGDSQVLNAGAISVNCNSATKFKNTIHSALAQYDVHQSSTRTSEEVK